MKAITILQPWASLIACGAKKIETRGWATKYRGPIAIHAGKQWEMWRRRLTYNNPFFEALWPVMTEEELKSDGYGRSQMLPVGAVIAIAELVDCVEIGHEAELASGIIVTGNELAFGDYSLGRYAWLLENVRPITPVPARGQQGLWNWEERL